MYSKMRIYPFIENFCHKAISEGNYESRLQKLRNILDHADYVVIGAGAGLSDAAGIAYSGKRFTDNFTDFRSDRHVFFRILSIQDGGGTMGLLGKAHSYEPLRYACYRIISPTIQCHKG